MRRGVNAAAAACIATGLAITPFAGATAANKAPTNVVADYQMESDTGSTMTDSAGAGTNDGVIAAGAATAGLDTHAASGIRQKIRIPTTVFIGAILASLWWIMSRCPATSISVRGSAANTSASIPVCRIPFGASALTSTLQECG